MSKPKKLENYLYTTMSAYPLVFDFEDSTIVEKCRAFDSRVNVLCDRFQTIRITGIDEDAILRYMRQIEPFNDELTKIKREFYDHFIQSLKNFNKNNWLYLDFCTLRHQSPVDFIFKNVVLRWRVGRGSEQRSYSDSTLISHPIFTTFLEQEPPETQRIVLEFERAKMQISIVSMRIRSQYNHACDLYKNHLTLKKIQAYYHSIGE